MLLIKQNRLDQPRPADETPMPSPAPKLRLHVELESACMPLVLERLRLAGQVPKAMEFQTDGPIGFVLLDLTRVNEAAANAFVPLLEQLFGVVSVNIEWLPGGDRWR
jgi:hypothetical protein